MPDRATAPWSTTGGALCVDSTVHERSDPMNQEQFRQFWEQLQAPLKAKWDKITEADLQDIAGDLGKFSHMGRPAVLSLERKLYRLR
jgi:hypothetical protein